MPVVTGCVEDILDQLKPYNVFRDIGADSLQVEFNTFELDDTVRVKVAIAPLLTRGKTDYHLTKLPDNCYLVFEQLPDDWAKWCQVRGIVPIAVGGMMLQVLKNLLAKQQVGESVVELIVHYLTGGGERLFVPQKSTTWLLTQLKETTGIATVTEEILGVKTKVSLEDLFDSVGTVQSLRILEQVVDGDLYRAYVFFQKICYNRATVLNMHRLHRLEELWFQALELKLMTQRVAWIMFLHEAICHTSRSASTKGQQVRSSGSSQRKTASSQG